MKIDVVDAHGKKTGSVEFPDEIFASPVNDTLLWEAVETYRANKRQGTAKAKTRGDVEGSKKKLFRRSISAALEWDRFVHRLESTVGLPMVLNRVPTGKDSR
jgi:ribosomal protein L4